MSWRTASGWVAAMWAACAVGLGAAGCGDDEPGGAADADVVAPKADAADDVGGEADAADEVAEDAVEPDAEPACAEGTPCDDGDPCTTDDACDAAGQCVGGGATCDDGLACTADTCDQGACEHTLVAGFCLTEGEAPSCVAHNGKDTAGCRLCDAEAQGGPKWKNAAIGALCDDGDACTADDRCEIGVCVGKTAVTCAPSTACMQVACEPAVGCVETPIVAACDDLDACTADDECKDGVCVGKPITCDDANPCTVDSCDVFEGCVYDPSSQCDDGDPCTEDACLVDGSCVNTPFDGPCEDGDLCTTGEQCAEGTCAGGEPVVCDDDNACTVDSCDPAKGCLHLFDDGGCDDGLECTTSDFCASGVCLGSKTETCPLCATPSSSMAVRVASLQIGDAGQPGDGLDVDGKLSTCSPAGDCSEGIDNNLGLLAPIVNPSMNQSIAEGGLHFVIDLSQATFDGQPFPLVVYDADLMQPWCDFTAATCNYRARQVSFDGDCTPYFAMDNAVIEAGRLRGGGKGSVITMVIPLSGSSSLPLTLADAVIEGDVSTTPDGTKIIGLNGVIAGALPKTQLIAAIEAFDEDLLPLDKEVVVDLLESIIEPDIDVDGDGVFESASLGMSVNTVPANLVP